MISFVVHYRRDTAEREVNFGLLYKFYTDSFPESQFIFVEESTERTLYNIRPEDAHILISNNGPHKKSLGYNLGFQCAKHDTVCFLDIDIIVDPVHIKTAAETVKRDGGVCIAYNGVALYLNYNGKRRLDNGISMDKMYSILPSVWHSMVPLSNYEYFQLAGVHSVGGCLLTTRQSFRSYNGFNPFFIGWGYEDNEIISRVHRLGYPVTKIADKTAYLFHLPHEVVAIDKSQHNFYRKNEAEVRKVEAMSQSQLREYIKTW